MVNQLMRWGSERHLPLSSHDQVTDHFSRSSAEEIPPALVVRRAYRFFSHVRAECRVGRSVYAYQGGEEGGQVHPERLEMLVCPPIPSDRMISIRDVRLIEQDNQCPVILHFPHLRQNRHSRSRLERYHGFLGRKGIQGVRSRTTSRQVWSG